MSELGDVMNVLFYWTGVISWLLSFSVIAYFLINTFLRWMTVTASLVAFFQRYPQCRSRREHVLYQAASLGWCTLTDDVVEIPFECANLLFYREMQKGKTWEVRQLISL